MDDTITKRLKKINHIYLSGGAFGVIYQIGALNKLMKYYKKSLEILPADHSTNAKSYKKIGEIFKTKGDYEKALEHVHKSIEIQKETLPANHSDISLSYSYIGFINSKKGKKQIFYSLLFCYF